MEKNSKKFELQQLPFCFEPQNLMRREDFMVSSCNAEAFKMIDVWPNWWSQGLVIYGPRGCGKSHLAHLFVEKVKSLSAKPLAVGIYDAKQINMRCVKRIAEENQSIVIENLSANVHAEALFHLFNLFNVDGKYMLWTAETAPSRMKFKLNDLQSRLNMLPSVEIFEPDDVMLQTLIVKLCADRQLAISPEILNYIVANARRSFAYIRDLIEEIDAISLAKQSAINYAVVKSAMEILQQKEDKQPDLFDEW